MSQISLKVHHSDVIRRFSIQGPCSYHEFQSHIASLFSLSPPFHLSYRDSDQDIVAISSDEEVDELFRLQSLWKSTVKLFITTPSDNPSVPSSSRAPRSAPTSPSSPPSIPASSRPSDPRPDSQRDTPHHSEPRNAPSNPVEPTLETVLSTIATVITNFSSILSSNGLPNTFPFSQSSNVPSRHNAPPFLLPFMTTGLRSAICAASSSTRAAFKRLRRAVRRSSNIHEIIPIAMAALPEVHEWTRHLSRSEAPHPDQIEAAVSIARRIAQPGGTSLVDAATEFVTTVVQDRVVLNALIDMVAGLSSASAGNASGSTTNSTFGARQVPNNRPFSVHANVQCNGCNMAPIRGVRYRATTRDDFDLCETCYAIEERRENIDTFDALKYVWESEFGDMCVPPPPLVLGDRGVRVAFLQKLLTDLGYMNASMYRFRIGGFGPNTRAGIEQFQRERSLEIAGEPGVYDALTAAYLASVLEAQEVGGAREAGGEEGGSGEATQATA